MDDLTDIPSSSLVYDWNIHDGPPRAATACHVADETLRDGLQSPSVIDPPIDDKLRLLHLMVRLGIQCADIGLPGAGARQYNDALRLAREVADQRLPIVVYCAARTLRQDIEPICEVSQRAGIPIEVACFIGSSPIRQYAEGWMLDQLRRLTEEAVSFAVCHDMPVMYVTEDTTRSTPDALRQLYTTAIECGARRVCLSDTVGHATPEGAAALVRFIRAIIAATGEDVRVDWHGHRDRGLDIPNCFAAWAAGADRCHGTVLGIGERCGNTPIELLLVNLQLMGLADRDLTALPEYTGLAARALGVAIPPNYPVVGADAFRTATGVHAAAVIKAAHKGCAWLADRIYSGVPAASVGRRQEIEIGPMSGLSNVRYYLAERGLLGDDRLYEDILAVAKRSNHVLLEREVLSIVKRDRAEPGTKNKEQRTNL
ncbi:MAG: LeuA family protein [Roseiflexaceae bacterium]